MFTVTNGIILKGQDLTFKKENIVVDDGIIVEIAKESREGKIIDVDGAIVCPSFINAHVHIGDSIIKDEGYGLSLGDMVRPPDGVKHKALANAEDEDMISAMKSTMWEMVESGTTHFIDYREGGIKGVELLREASKDIPIKPIILGRDDSFYGEDPDLKKVKIAVRKLLKIADGIAPSGFGEISDEVAQTITEECKKQGRISSIHVAESEANQVESINNSGKTEIEKGIDSSFNQLVHLTNPRGNDLEMTAKSDSNIVVCPRANATLNVGVVPLNEMLNLGIRPLIGSDNVMINSPNMFKELEFTLKLMAVHYNNYLNPRELLKMATTNVCGSAINSVVEKSMIEVGHPAEFIVSNSFSINPYLNMINRCESKDILYTINKKIDI